MGQQQLLIGGNVAQTDPYFNSVSLLLTGSGTDGSSTSASGGLRDSTDLGVWTGQFAVESSNPFFGAYPYDKSNQTVSFRSETTQGTASYQLLQASYTNFITSNTFCVEGWTKLNNVNNEAAVVNLRSGSTDYLRVVMNGSGFVYLVTLANNVGFQASATGIPVTEWFHFAACGTSTGVKFYINGQQVGTTGPARNFIALNYANLFGYFSGVTPIATPYCSVSNLRIVDGNAVYTSNFTPPTSPLTIISGTKSLLNGIWSGGNPNTNIYNLAPSSSAVTAYEYATTSSQSNFGGKSIQLVNAVNGSEVLLARSLSFPNPKGPLTFEFWYRTSTTASIIPIIRLKESTTAVIEINQLSNGTIEFKTNGASRATSLAITANTWYHIAVVKYSDNTVAFYFNGIRLALLGNVISFNCNNVYSIDNRYGGANTYPTYWLDQIRFTPGISRYSGATYTVPSSAFPSSPPSTSVYGEAYFPGIDGSTVQYQFVVPPGVTSISAVCVGSGGRYAGGGGGLGYATIDVTPGERLVVQTSAAFPAGVGSNSEIRRAVGNTLLLYATCGGSGYSVYSATPTYGAGGTWGTGGTGVTNSGGGNGGNGGQATLVDTWNGTYRWCYSGGGGAGGYTGNGGTGATIYNNGGNGAGGGGGGGGSGGYWTQNSGDPCYVDQYFYAKGGRGGGVSLYGFNGQSGTGGLYNEDTGFEGDPGSYSGTVCYPQTFVGGGAGAGLFYPQWLVNEDCSVVVNAWDDHTQYTYGSVRIIWGPGRFYPSTNTQQYVE